MSRSGELWMIEFETAQERFSKTDDEDEFRAALRQLGFDPTEIDYEIEKARS